MTSPVKIEKLSYDFTCYWRIENFDPSNGFAIQSPMFEIEALKSKWYLEIAEEDGSVGVFLFKGTEPKYCLTKFCISLLVSINWVPVLENPSYRYKDGGCGYGMFNAVSLLNLREEPWVYLPNGSFTISFHAVNRLQNAKSSQCLMISRMVNRNELLHRPIELFSNLKPSDLLSFPPSYAFYSNEVQFNAAEVQTRHTQTEAKVDLDTGELLNLLKIKQFSFITLRTPNKEFVVPKAVLCANSPVFNALFERQGNGNDCNSIDVEDMDSDGLTSFVQFLHMQHLDNLCWDIAVTLYYAAHKYQIDLLKKECIAHLEKELSVENVCDAFLLADLHDDKDLMSCVQEYFGKNLKLIFISKQWKDFLCHTELVAKILYNLGQNM